MTVVCLDAERAYREFRLIALSRAVFETLHADPEDPTPTIDSLQDMLVDFDAMSAAEIEMEYRWEVAASAVPPGEPMNVRIDPAPYHDAVLEKAKAYLTRIERDFGVSLLGRRA